jgi:HAMP domain-containing protein
MPFPVAGDQAAPAAAHVAEPVLLWRRGWPTLQVRRFVIAELITGGALLAMLAIGGEWLIGRGLDPLGKMASTAHDITTRGDPTARMPDPRDHTEVALLGSAINTMLDRASWAKARRRAGDLRMAPGPGHALRATPTRTQYLAGSSGTSAGESGRHCGM